ncbi:MAG: Malate dehydrogenase [Candidatus Collierbacteria bacterium GW2011_GWA1_42_60]|uniref:Malate dehydrogenase n=1 Tax=Candidatus Collierbacteria bacterium GW2011_GWA2_42_17 TaxID=1618378 RepID=A0A0G0Z2C7_9BACT|nr:MAG: Malate dehydrogenase [Candidatus Collierbacteria bacterium GW2011_GWB2_42_12]KKS42934.1 MAG: Malate dehydrogenase [Candidatus Collierbacteria bacterium GW2011_GWA2_42_17]KKS61694.1 MAG: Malate dehydrogenase [Candidatus Collierbacteria bacterium GW2011_GWF1_42_50]KKS62854.1 MAG: Malate dehydrogenase [Candidatus Collierbacteria bacterium GW2011_GWD2_42_50]KKS67700.1 MAG: Malate dehydrogenase [Candidatus Collierbacteria bacterium GW2011_GWA1_42_60]
MMVVIFGLSKMSGTGTNLTTDQSILLDGAKLVKENGETVVTVVNFSDMECPACKRAHSLIGGLYSDNIPGVKIVFRHFPLGIHKNSIITARAVEAARVMGKGFEMIDLLFDTQEEWTGESKIEDMLVEYAKSLGLDEKIFKEKLNSVEVAEVVQQDVNLGNSLRLSGTPTIYVNGEQMAVDFVMDKVTELLKKNNGN